MSGAENSLSSDGRKIQGWGDLLKVARRNPAKGALCPSPSGSQGEGEAAVGRGPRVIPEPAVWLGCILISTIKTHVSPSTVMQGARGEFGPREEGEGHHG